MRQSHLFTRTRKEAPKDEVSKNAQLLIRAGYIDKLAGGIYSYLPLGLRVLQNISKIIRDEMNALGGQEIFMPALHTKKDWEPTGRWNSFDVLYKLKDASGREFALGPTHEEIVVPLVQRQISSYKDFPFAVYQIQNKFRMELRSKSGIMRGREFLMKDLYSFHLNEEDLDKYYLNIQLVYEKIFNMMGLEMEKRTFLTYASGGTFSRYSHEYQTISEAGEDVISICESCHIAINKEIKEDTPQCPMCKKEDFHDEKAIEIGNIFKLNDKFTAPYKFTVMDEHGEDVPVLMGCYGIGLGRVMGTIAEVYHDEDGLAWPESIAPFRVHLLALGNDEDILRSADMIYEEMRQAGVEVLYDDRNISNGEKFSDADLLGMPYRVVISPRSMEHGGAEVKKRSASESEVIALDKIIPAVKP